MYARVIDGEIVGLSATRPRMTFEDGRWWDYRDDSVLAERGWQEVVPSDRPQDTETHYWVSTYVVVEGVATQVWAEQEKTVEMVEAEAERKAKMDDLEARVARIEAHLWPAPDAPTDPTDPTVPTWGDLGGVWPNEGLLLEGGVVYRNISGVPLTDPPSEFPGAPARWKHLFVVVVGGTDPTDPTDPTRPDGYVGPWSADDTYAVGDVVDRGGRYYRCKVAHGPEYQGTWGPPQVSVWDDLGEVTVTTAAQRGSSRRANPKA